jgi:hypothetical protein
METGNCYNADCPAREVLGHVTGRWGGLVLGALLHGTRRYSVWFSAASTPKYRRGSTTPSHPPASKSPNAS